MLKSLLVINKYMYIGFSNFSLKRIVLIHGHLFGSCLSVKMPVYCESNDALVNYWRLCLDLSSLNKLHDFLYIIHQYDQTCIVMLQFISCITCLFLHAVSSFLSYKFVSAS